MLRPSRTLRRFSHPSRKPRPQTSVFVPSPQYLEDALGAPPINMRANSKALDWQEVFLKLFALYTEHAGMSHLAPEKSLLLEA